MNHKEVQLFAVLDVLEDLADFLEVSDGVLEVELQEVGDGVFEFSGGLAEVLDRAFGDVLDGGEDGFEDLGDHEGSVGVGPALVVGDDLLGEGEGERKQQLESLQGDGFSDLGGGVEGLLEDLEALGVVSEGRGDGGHFSLLDGGNLFDLLGFLDLLKGGEGGGVFDGFEGDGLLDDLGLADDDLEGGGSDVFGLFDHSDLVLEVVDHLVDQRQGGALVLFVEHGEHSEGGVEVQFAHVQDRHGGASSRCKDQDKKLHL